MSFISGRDGRLRHAFGNPNIILPNLVTILGLLSGLYSIVLSMNSRFGLAAIALLLAALFDFLDGKVARLMKGSSEFGVQLDSLCDLVSFGVAPALLVYNWVLLSFGRLGIMAVFLFVACGALRLARFNVQAGKISSKYFVGLPIPGAAAFIASSVLFAKDVGLVVDKNALGVFFLVSIYVLGLLMVSTIPFYSFKKFGYFKEKPFNALVFIVAFIGLNIFYFERIFFASIVLYIVVNLLLALLRVRKKGGDSTDNNPVEK